MYNLFMSSETIFKTIKILAVIGVILACYLLFEQITQSPFRPCNISAVVNCNAVIFGPVAKTLGIPTPLYGLVGYLVIFFGTIFKKKKLILGMATFGLAFCLRITYIELFQLHVICPVCIACQLIMISVFTLAILLVRRR